MKYFPDQDKYWNEEITTSLGYLYGLVLDVGAGNRTPHAWDITLDNKNIEAHIKANGDKIPFQNNYFDCVYAGHALEHFEDILGTLKEWIRVVKVFGHIVIICPDCRFTPPLGRIACDPQHRHDLTFDYLNEICQLLDNVRVINKNTIALQNWSFQVVLQKIK